MRKGIPLYRHMEDSFFSSLMYLIPRILILFFLWLESSPHKSFSKLLPRSEWTKQFFLIAFIFSGTKNHQCRGSSPLNLNVAVELIYCPHLPPRIGPIHGCLHFKECFDFVNYNFKSVYRSYILSFFIILLFLIFSHIFSTCQHQG